MDSIHIIGTTITSVAAALALGVVTLPARADNTTEFAQQLDQSDGVKASDALWTNNNRELITSPPYSNANAVSVPGSAATDAARAGQREQSGDTVTPPSDATTSAPIDARDPTRAGQVGTPLDQPKSQ
jgi:hypothetical protein